jgi:hypothetical protein
MDYKLEYEKFCRDHKSSTLKKFVEPLNQSDLSISDYKILYYNAILAYSIGEHICHYNIDRFQQKCSFKSSPWLWLYDEGPKFNIWSQLSSDVHENPEKYMNLVFSSDGKKLLYN